MLQEKHPVTFQKKEKGLGMKQKAEKIKVVPGHPELTKKLKLYNALVGIGSLVLIACMFWFMKMPPTGNMDIPFLTGMAGALVTFVSLFLYKRTYKKAEKVMNEQSGNIA